MWAVVVFIDKNGLAVLKALGAKCSMMYHFSLWMFSVVAGYGSLLGGAGVGWWVEIGEMRAFRVGWL